MAGVQLNLNHLHYFWMVARAGGVTQASRQLRVAQPTISAQVIALERALGRSLFSRKNQRLVLTEDGEVVLDYANQVFDSAQEMLEVLRGRPVEARTVIRLGVVDQVSKQIVLALMKQIQAFRPHTLVTIHEGSLTHILGELRVHTLDLILSNIDVPADETGDFAKAQVGRLPVCFVASPAVARHAGPFPACLSKVPLLLPTRASPIWTKVEHFLNRHQITPQILAEAQGVELLRLMACEGMGVAPLNTIAALADLRSGRLVRLNARPTGIYKTIWLIAKKRRRPNPLMEHLASHFRIRVPQAPAQK
jgi:LysR family transcriptional activator of nhaA